ncbi:pentapeptide repeat-containing protein [Streptomyces phaeochromogenes]|uniref:pentapeptide repeat-containing protein n=1 Tax=Streptomyces phaeochromogenes TaxID=1923 RepID=UPI0033CBE860
MSTPPPPVPGAPSWPYCAQGADPDNNPVGCHGIHVPGHTACLAHLTDTDRDAYLAGLTPGASIDHRGTSFTPQLLNELLDALHYTDWGQRRFGDVDFEGAKFSGDAGFGGVEFAGVASFDGVEFAGVASFDEVEFTEGAWFGGAKFSWAARFGGAKFLREARFDGVEFSGEAAFGRVEFTGAAWFNGVKFFGEARFDGVEFFERAWFGEAKFFGAAWFGGAKFSGNAGFGGVEFSEDAWFGGVEFSGQAAFDRVEFTGAAWFNGVKFSGDARFGEAKFLGSAWFSGVRFSECAFFDGAKLTEKANFFHTVVSGNARFDDVQFEGASSFGPLVCAASVGLAGAVFMVPVTLEIAARKVDCERTQWDSTATIRLRYATVDLSHAVLSAPVAITAHPTLFNSGTPVDESLLAGPVEVRVASVRGTDAAHLVLTDTDLSDCLFSGAFHLDQLRLEGRTTLAATPVGWHRRGIWPVRWTRRRTLAEEHSWRAQTTGQPALPAGTAPQPRQWRPGPHHPDPALTPDPEDVAALYRHLRKAFEDGKNEPGAADFYYGECEMRRHDHTSTPKSERRLLWAYWLLSGYGLRASRATGWLLAAMAVTVLLLMGFGLPTHDPDPVSTGMLHGPKISLTTSTPDPELDGGWPQRMTWVRAEKATRVAVNSVVFRSSGQNLTAAGTYIEMTSRLLEPTLLALAALAIRGRIKR